MTQFSASLPFDHGRAERTGVLLLQLGTPTEPQAGPVRRYLREFLSDPRVVEIPRAVWLPILHGIVLRTRPAKSAQKYAAIWTDAGSPLAVITERQTSLLRGLLGERGLDVEVAYAMRYGGPSIPSVLRDLRDRGVTRLLALPLYPQYAGSTTATAFDSIARELAGWRNLPSFRFLRSFHDHTDYIDALAARIRESWAQDGEPDVLLMSFHGVPRRTLLQGDPYHCECLVTGRLLAERLGLAAGRWRVSFQSLFGRAEWLRPYTDEVLRELGQAGTARVDVVCPGFVADCLETLEEIAIEGRHTFTEAGGSDYRHIPCLNESPAFIATLANLAEREMHGWPITRSDPVERERADACLAARRERALSLGADS